ncbi:MAG: Fic family protein [bacterium]|nr:Fic family protein [bacterium]
MFNPKYQITQKILSDLTKISEIKALVEKGHILPSREAFLRKTALIKMAHTSTSIEGNTLEEYQVEKVAKGEKVTAAENEILEVKNYLEALKLVDESEKAFGTKEILNIHKTVTLGLIDKNKVGMFRKSPVYVVNILASGIEKIIYTPPKFGMVEPLVDELVAWMNSKDEIHPIIKAGIFHYQFVSIHPFVDGNGRSARLLTLLSLYQSGYTFKKSLVLEDYYNNDRKRYYESLQTGKDFEERKNADLTSWLEYFTQGFLFETQRLKDQILSFSNLSKGDVVLNVDELKIVDFAVNLGKVTSGDVADMLDIPKRTAQDKLKKLVNSGVLKKIGLGPNTYYKFT